MVNHYLFSLVSIVKYLLSYLANFLSSGNRLSYASSPSLTPSPSQFIFKYVQKVKLYYLFKSYYLEQFIVVFIDKVYILVSLNKLILQIRGNKLGEIRGPPMISKSGIKP